MGKIYSAGTIAVDTLDTAIEMCAIASTGNYSTFEKPVGTAYQVPAGKLFKIGLIYFSSAIARGSLKIGYGDDSVADSGTPPTNFVELIKEIPVEIADAINEKKAFLKIPAEKYPCIQALTGEGNCIILGIVEE